MQFNKKVFVGALTILAIGISSLTQAKEQAAFVYLGPTSDHGWSYSHEQGRIKADKALAGKYQTSYIENVPETADAERIIRN